MKIYTNWEVICLEEKTVKDYLAVYRSEFALLKNGPS